MDPHGNMSRRLITALDLATSHRMSPHEDAPLTKQRAVANLVACLDRGVRPRKAWVRVPVLLPGEKASTRDDPARGIYGRLAAVTAKAGIIDAAVWIGYAWADEPRCGAAVVVTGTDEDAIAREARALAEMYWDARKQFAFSTEAGDADWCIETGLASRERPFFISDSGDNPTAGGSRGRRVHAREAVRESRALVGPRDRDLGERRRSAGGRALRHRRRRRVGRSARRWRVRCHARHQVALRGEVQRLMFGDPVGGDIAVVASGGVRAILTSRRKPFHFIRDFTDLGLDPATHDLTVVKVGYLVPDLFEAAKGWVLALTPGGVDQDIVRLGHRRLDRPIYPLDPEMPTPDLAPVILH